MCGVEAGPWKNTGGRGERLVTHDSNSVIFLNPIEKHVIIIIMRKYINIIYLFFGSFLIEFSPAKYYKK